MSFKTLSSRDNMSTFRLRNSFSAFSKFTCCNVWIVLIFDFVLFEEVSFFCDEEEKKKENKLALLLCKKRVNVLPALLDCNVVSFPSLPVLVTVLVEDDAIDTRILTGIVDQVTAGSR